MERTKERKSIKKFLNRSFSYLVLLLSIFAVCYSINKIVNYVQIKNENTALEETLTDLRTNNQKYNYTALLLRQ